MRQRDGLARGDQDRPTSGEEAEARWLSALIAALSHLTPESLHALGAHDVAPAAARALFYLGRRRDQELPGPDDVEAFALLAEWGGFARLAPGRADAFGGLEVVAAEDVGVTAFPPRVIAYAQALGATLVELARYIDDADSRLELGLKVKSQLRKLIGAAQGDGLRYHRHLATLMFDAVRRVRPESLTERHVSVLQECADRLASESLSREALQACDQALLQAGMDALPDIPED